MTPYARFEAACQRLAPYASLFLRIGIGWVFLRHGIGKVQGGLHGVATFFQSAGIPLPTVSAAIVMTVETAGAACVLLGLFTRFWAACMVLEMAVAIAATSLPSHRGFELEGLLLTGALALVALGDGKVSVGAVVKRKT